jgi:hypothetical protein
MNFKDAKALGVVLANSAGKVPFLERLPSRNSFRLHKWVKNKRLLNPQVCLAKDSKSPPLLIGIVEWSPTKRPGAWYVIGISQADLGTTEIELHQVDSSGADFIWKYKPIKQDGWNNERKAIFAKKYPFGEARVSVPVVPEAVPLFIEELWERVTDRRSADELTSLSGRARKGPEPTDNIEAGFLEGAARARYVVHRYREQRLRKAKIADELKRKGKLACEVCEFDFKASYGSIGEGFTHVHHKIPFNSFQGVRETQLSELAIVCANCHAMIHVGGKSRHLDEVKLQGVKEQRRE